MSQDQAKQVVEAKSHNVSDTILKTLNFVLRATENVIAKSMFGGL